MGCLWRALPIPCVLSPRATTRVQATSWMPSTNSLASPAAASGGHSAQPEESGPFLCDAAFLALRLELPNIATRALPRAKMDFGATVSVASTGLNISQLN